MKINLIKNRPLKSARLNKLKLVVRWIMIITIGGFLLEVFYVSGKIVYLKTRISSAKKEVALYNKYLSDAQDLVENYVWAQSVVEKMLEERKNEYKYKDYLLQINSWLTPGARLKAVSFAGKSDISILISAADVDGYRNFEEKLTSLTRKADFAYSSLEQENLARLDDGSYVIKMKLKIK